MTKASKSVYYFGFYLFATGLTLIFMPNMLLNMFGIEPTSEVRCGRDSVLFAVLGVFTKHKITINQT